MPRLNPFNVVIQVFVVVLLGFTTAYIGLSLTPIAQLEESDLSIGVPVDGSVDFNNGNVAGIDSSISSDLTGITFQELLTNTRINSEDKNRIVVTQVYQTLTEPKGSEFISLYNESNHIISASISANVPTQFAQDIIVEGSVVEAQVSGQLYRPHNENEDKAIINLPLSFYIPPHTEIKLSSLITPLTNINYPVEISYIIQ